MQRKVIPVVVAVKKTKGKKKKKKKKKLHRTVIGKEREVDMPLEPDRE